MKNPFGVKTYAIDLPLFKQLGLTPFESEDSHYKSLVGVIKHDLGEIAISVECMPAMFWIFQIYSVENDKTFEIHTGSGALVDYWPMAAKVAAGMFVPEKIEKGNKLPVTVDIQLKMKELVA